MKIIITGATGLIGGGALKRALEVPEVTEVVVLARRDINIKDPKLTWIIKKDFDSWTEDELASLKGAEACIWSLGAPLANIHIKTGWPRVALQAFTKTLAPALPDGKRFRFILTSGALVIADQERKLLPGMGLFQTLGKLEVEWAQHEEQHKAQWRSLIVRPAAVYVPGSWSTLLLPASIKIDVPTLSAAMVDIALHDNEKQTLDNSDLTRIGKTVLEKQGKVNN